LTWAPLTERDVCPREEWLALAPTRSQEVRKMAENHILTQMTIPLDRIALPAREPWPEVGTTLFADDPEAARDHGSDGPTK
jgi:hypothetical protein